MSATVLRAANDNGAAQRLASCKRLPAKPRRRGKSTARWKDDLVWLALLCSPMLYALACMGAAALGIL